MNKYIALKRVETDDGPYLLMAVPAHVGSLLLDIGCRVPQRLSIGKTLAALKPSLLESGVIDRGVKYRDKMFKTTGPVLQLGWRGMVKDPKP